MQYEMLWDIVTLFPNMFSSPLEDGVLGKAIKKGIIKVNIHNIRDFARDVHRTADDVPYGGGPGMVLKGEPLFDTLGRIKGNSSPYTVYLSPRGKRFNQETAQRLADKKHVTLICGRYEDIDQRVIDRFVDKEISIGDYVLSGGELPAMVLIDGVSRLLRGVLGDPQSHEGDSFSSGLLDHPHYTRPEVIKGMKVPGVLLSGNHREIRNWRLSASIKETVEKRPDIFLKMLTKKEEVKKPSKKKIEFYVALVHHPVYNKCGETVATSITNMDIHDISRTAITFGAAAYYLVTPLQSQIEVCERIIGHWKDGHGAVYNKDRFTAFKNTFTVESVDALREKIKDQTGKDPLLVFTSAKRYKESVKFEKGKEKIEQSSRPVLVLFGTGWGMVDSVREKSDIVLEPILGRHDYNHLSVRSAVAIILDRLFGKRGRA